MVIKVQFYCETKTAYAFHQSGKPRKLFNHTYLISYLKLQWDLSLSLGLCLGSSLSVFGVLKLIKRINTNANKSDDQRNLL